MFGLRNRRKNKNTPVKTLSRRWKPILECLEDRTVPTTNVFLDFGFNFPGGSLNVTDTDMARGDIRGPQVFPGGHTIIGILQTVQNRNIDLNADGLFNLADANILAGRIVQAVQRELAPFNIIVSQASATSINDIATSLGANGNGAGNRDAYVVVAGTSDPAQSAFGWAPVDVGNNFDNTCFAFLDQMIGSLGVNVAPTALGRTAAHESGHTFGLSHTNQSDLALGLLGVADFIGSPGSNGTGDNRDFSALHIVTRFDLLLADSGATQNNYNILANAAVVGAAPGAPAYVTGTGGWDRITITQNANPAFADVSIQVFDSGAFTNQIASTSYQIAVGNGILIDTGHKGDETIIDARLGVNVTVRGGDDSTTGERVIFNGFGAANVGTWTQATATTSGLNFNSTRTFYSGNFTFGTTNVNIQELKDSSQVRFRNVSQLTINGSGGNDSFNATRISPTEAQFTGLLNGVTLLPAILETNGVTGVTINGLAGNDSLVVDHGNGIVNFPINFDGGTGTSATLTVQGNSGGNFNQFIYTVTAPGAGSVNLDGNVVNFTNLTPVTVTSIAGTTTITNASALNGTTTTLSAAGGGLNQVVFNGGLEMLNFANPTVALNVNGNNLDDTITLNALDAGFAAATISIDAGDGQDLIQILAKPNSAVLNTNTGLGTPNDRTVIGNTWVNFLADNDLGTLANINGTVNINDSGTIGQVYIDDSSNVTGTSGTVTSATITVGAKTFNYNGMNIVQLRTGLGNDNYTIQSTNAAATTTVFLNAGADTARVNPGVFGIAGTTVVNGDEGNDTFYAWLTPFAQISINGGSPVVGDPGVPPGDKLVIGTFGATVVPFNSPDGVVSAPGFNALNFTSIETLIIPDRFELNNTVATATFLGSPPYVTLDRLSIHSVDDPNTPANEADIDYFRYTAHDTGYLVVNSFFSGGAVAGSDLTLQIRDSADNILATINTNGVDGERLVVPVVSQQVYYIRVSGTNPLTDTNNYNLEIENFKAPVPTVVDLLAISDTGRSDSDNITSTLLNGNVTTVDIQADLTAFANEGIPILTGLQAAAGLTSGAAVEVFLEGVSVGFATVLAGSGNTHFRFSFTGQLAEGVNKITSAIRIFDIHNPRVSGRELLGSPPLLVTVDTVAPTIQNLRLNPPDDSGIPGQPSTYNDRITKYAAANFTGNASAFDWIQLTAFDSFGNPIPDFGTSATSALGQYFIDPVYDLNDPQFFTLDGERNFVANAFDIAGNASVGTPLQIFLDTRGPQVAGVSYRYVDVANNTHVINLLDQTNELGMKVSAPLMDYIDVSLVDQPNRTANFLTFDPNVSPDEDSNRYEAANFKLATTPGNYSIVGKRTGNVVITNIIVLEDATADGTPGQTTYRLFLSKPLADDKYTFKIFDRVQDQAGNALDGDFQPPSLPSGDGVPGGNFVISFLTVDSRAELGFYANGTVNLDLNGDYIINPGSQVGDDLVNPYTPIGSAVFAGQFFGPDNVDFGIPVDGYDRLGTYGKEGTKYVFRRDLNNDGDFNDPFEKTIQTSLQINGLPVAGNWGDVQVPNAVTGLNTGESVGLFDGTKWYLDRNADNIIQPSDIVLTTNMRGLPFTGDFNGDGYTDLGTFQNGVFYLNLSPFAPITTGNYNFTFRASLPNSVSATALKLGRPVSADFDADGIDDIGLFLPNQTTVPAGQASWFLMNSNGLPWDLQVVNGGLRPFKNATTGLGADVAVTYGSAKALPVVGNFDPIQKSTTTGVSGVANTKSSTATALAKSLKTSMSAVAKNLTDLYFEGTDATDKLIAKPRRRR